MGWTVTAADESGFTIKQTIERIEMNLATPQGPAIALRLGSRRRGRRGRRRDLATALQPLVGAEFEIKLSPRGEVLEAEPVNEAAKALFAANEKGGETGDAPRATVEKLLRQSLVVLPEKEVTAGETWTTTQRTDDGGRAADAGDGLIRWQRDRAGGREVAGRDFDGVEAELASRRFNGEGEKPAAEDQDARAAGEDLVCGGRGAGDRVPSRRRSW